MDQCYEREGWSSRDLNGEMELSANPPLGTVVFCPSVSPVGSPELYPFYLYLVRRALESVDVYPKVECTDVVRWSCYEDGTVLLLNTEYNLKQHAVVHFGPSSSRKVRLAPGELKIVR